MESTVGITRGERPIQGSAHESEVRVITEGDPGQSRAKGQQLLASLIGEPGVEIGLQSLGKDIPDTAGGPATVREEGREVGCQGVRFEPFV